MGLTMKTTSGGNFDPAPEGTHAAVCTRVVDCGTQDTKFGPKRRIQLGFEIDAKRDDGLRFMAFGNYTLSMNEKATLRKHLESWRGRKYGDDEDVDISGLIGKPCLLTLVKSDDGEYTNISAISALVRGVEPLKPEGDTVLFDCDSPDLGELDKLGDRMQERIRETDEFQRAMRGDPKAAENVGEPDDLDDDIPF